MTPGVGSLEDKGIDPHPTFVATMRDLRHSQLKEISDRLGRLSKWRWSRLWFALAFIFLGAAIGALLAMPPFLDGNPSETATNVYWAGIGGSALLALVFAVAGFTTQRERADSIAGIKEDLDKMLKPYETALAAMEEEGLR